MVNCFLFFKQKTAYDMRISDWSADVCSSDLRRCRGGRGRRRGFGFRRRLWRGRQRRAEIPILARAGGRAAAEEEIFIGADGDPVIERKGGRSEEHTSELQSLMRISYAVFCLNKKKKQQQPQDNITYRIPNNLRS